jgi:hypothetical protein
MELIMFSKKLVLLCLIVLSLFSITAFASPWECMNDWVNEHTQELQVQGISFWHQNSGLIEAYAFDDPVGLDLSTHGRIGALIYAMAYHCGCTATDGLDDPRKHIEGLCGHY